MTHDRRPLDDDIRSFLVDRSSVPLPPTLIEAIEATVRRTPQARTGWWERPIPLRSAVPAFAAAVAVGAVIAAVGVGLLGVGGPPGPASSGRPGIVATTQEATSAPTDPTSMQVTPPNQSAAESHGPTIMPSPSASETPLAAAPLPSSSWTLLAEAPGGGEPATIEAALTPSDFQRIWRRSMATEPVPSLGADEFAIFFHKQMPWSCTTITLRALEYRPAEHLIYGDWTPPRDCSSEIGSVRTFVVTLKRPVFPAGQLQIHISRQLDNPCGAACGFDEDTSITLPAPSLVSIEQVAGSAQTVIEGRLHAATGSSCGSSWSGSFARPSDPESRDIDRRVASDASPFWYSETYWVGDRGLAPEAFGASAALEDEQGDLWIEVGAGASAEGIRLGHVDTPAGNAMWYRVGGVKAIPCGGATDPVASVMVGRWSVRCHGVADADCAGAAERFVNLLAWSSDGVFDATGGVLTVQPRPVCPPVPEWADGPYYWEVTAMRSLPTGGDWCMVIAKHSSDERYPPYVHVGGPDGTGSFGGTPPGWPSCEGESG